MAKVTILSGHNLNALAHLAGSNRQNLSLVGDEFDVPDVSQPDLDTALADYVANQAARDADFQVVRDGETVGELQQKFGDDEVLNAVVEVMRTELNNLRAQHTGMPAISAGAMDGAVRAKIANP